MSVETVEAVSAALRRATSASWTASPRARKSAQVSVPGSALVPSSSTTWRRPFGRPAGPCSFASAAAFSTNATAASACSAM